MCMSGWELWVTQCLIKVIVSGNYRFIMRIVLLKDITLFTI